MSLKKQSPEKARAFLLVMAGLASAVLLSGAATDGPDLAARRREIEGMTQAEVNQLRRNYENFKKLSPEQREAILRLHEEIVQDTANNGTLQRLLQSYNNWFTRLSPFDRDAILSITDPAERAIRVQKMHEEQLQQHRARAQAEAFPAVARPAHPGGVPTLKPATLEAIVTAIEKNFLSEQAKQDLPNLAPGRERHLRIFRLAKNQIDSQRQIAIGDASFEAALLETIRTAITDEDVVARLKEQPNPVFLARILRQSLLAEWHSELTSAPPTDAEIDAFVEEWKKYLGPRQRENFEKRIQSASGRRFLSTEVALARNPELRELRQVVNWLAGPPLRPRRGKLLSGAFGGKANRSPDPASHSSDNSSGEHAAPARSAPTARPGI